jgi:hypothetical protein
VLGVEPRLCGLHRRLAQNLVDVAQFKFSLLQLFMAFRTAALSSIRRHRFRFS